MRRLVQDESEGGVAPVAPGLEAVAFYDAGVRAEVGVDAGFVLERLARRLFVLGKILAGEVGIVRLANSLGHLVAGGENDDATGVLHVPDGHVLEDSPAL